VAFEPPFDMKDEGVWPRLLCVSLEVRCSPLVELFVWIRYIIESSVQFTNMTNDLGDSRGKYVPVQLIIVYLLHDNGIPY